MQKIFNISEKTKIYILAPAGVVTGGVELLHQLCDVLNRNGAVAYIVYQGENEHRVPADYQKYKINVTESYNDLSYNIIVLPEIYINKLTEIEYSQVMIWWLSVDNYFKSLQGSVLDNFYFNYKFAIKCLINSILKTLVLKELPKKYSLSKIFANKQVICNACQSEYSIKFLEKNGIKNTYFLSDYINEDYIYNSTIANHKQNIIIYNPKKGIKFTKKLIKFAPDLKWIPLQNMTRSEVRQIMNKAKVYIDFGNFPGKDRMPREAAMCGCCIITGKLGAAGFSKDLPISGDFKFNQRTRDISKIVDKIRFQIDNYETEIEKYKNYRDFISNEKMQFEKDAVSLLTSKKYNGGGTTVE